MVHLLPRAAKALPYSNSSVDDQKKAYHELFNEEPIPRTKMRIPIPDNVAAEVLFRQNRTCCVCQEPGKRLQIHHIDDDPSNNNQSNLVGLCFTCHDDTQISGGFGRKLNAMAISSMPEILHPAICAGPGIALFSRGKTGVAVPFKF